MSGDWNRPRPSQTTVPAAAAATTAGPGFMVTTPTTSSTSRPTPSATNLYTGHGTPAIRTSVPDVTSLTLGAVIPLTIARILEFGQPKRWIRPIFAAAA
jgi:hypothetical protein